MVVFFQDINHYNDLKREHWYDWASQLEYMIGYGYQNIQDTVVVAIWSTIFALLFCSVFWAIQSIDREFSWRDFFGYTRKRFIGVWLGNLFLCTLFMVMPWYLLLPLFFIIPFFFVNAAAMGLDQDGFGLRFKKGFKYSSSKF